MDTSWRFITNTNIPNNHECFLYTSYFHSCAFGLLLPFSQRVFDKSRVRYFYAILVLNLKSQLSCKPRADKSLLLVCRGAADNQAKLKSPTSNLITFVSFDYFLSVSGSTTNLVFVKVRSLSPEVKTSNLQSQISNPKPIPFFPVRTKKGGSFIGFCIFFCIFAGDKLFFRRKLLKPIYIYHEKPNYHILKPKIIVN